MAPTHISSGWILPWVIIEVRFPKRGERKATERRKERERGWRGEKKERERGWRGEREERERREGGERMERERREKGEKGLGPAAAAIESNITRYPLQLII